MQAEDMVAFVEATAQGNPDARVVIVQTAFIDYLPPEIRGPFENNLRAFVAAHPDRAVWMGLEDAIDPVIAKAKKRFPAEMRLRRASRTHLVAGCDWHPSVVEIDHAELEEARSP